MQVRVLIFDDDEDILFICSFLIKSVGWEVQTYTDCSDIFDKLEKSMPTVIIIDNCIHGPGGLEVIKMIKLHSSFKNIPVIYFSAYNEIKTLAEIAGADAYLAKPFNLDELEKVINSVIEKQDEEL